MMMLWQQRSKAPLLGRRVFDRHGHRAVAPQLRAASALAGEVLRSSDSGLLVASDEGGQDSKGRPLGAGSVVQHENNRFVCVFRVDRYWFAAPLVSAAASKGTMSWIGNPLAVAASASSPSSSSSSSGKATKPHAGDVDLRAVVACLQRPTPTQQERAPLSQGLHTGMIALDTLAPIGRGQSLLVCGPAGAGKSTLAREVVEQVLAAGLVDQALRFRLDPCTPLVAAPVQGVSSYAELSVTPQAAQEKPAMLLVPMLAAVAAAEAARDAGRHALLVLDSMEPLLDAWRLAAGWVEEVSGHPLEKESAQVQRRDCFSGLMERAASLLPASEGGSGGSLTLILLAETEAMAAVGASGAVAQPTSGFDATTYILEDFSDRKESEQIRLRNLVSKGIALNEKTLATVRIALPSGSNQSASASSVWGDEVAAMRELQSLSDGQVVLDRAAAERGEFPTVVHGATFSRFGLGGASNKEAQASGAPARKPRDVRSPALQAVAAHLRMELALLQEARFRPAEKTDADDGAHSRRMQVVCKAFLQAPRTPVQPEEMTALLMVACGGALDSLTEAEAAAALSGGARAPLLEHLREAAPEVLRSISEEQSVSKAVLRELEVAVRLFLALQKASSAAGAASALG